MNQISQTILRLMIELFIVGSLLCIDTSKAQTCTPETYAASEPYASSVAYVLADLISVTPSQKGYDYYASSSSSSSSPVAYGHATCNQTLANACCAACLASARTSLIHLCALCVSGRVTTVDCGMSYQSSAYSLVDIY